MLLVFFFSFQVTDIIIIGKKRSSWHDCLIEKSKFYYLSSFSAVDSGAMQLSPIFFGILLTILILISYCVVRILWKRSQQHKADDVTDGSKQSSSLLCTSVVGNTNGTANNANHTDTITKVGAFYAQRQRFFFCFFLRVLDCRTAFTLIIMARLRYRYHVPTHLNTIQYIALQFTFMRASLVELHVFHTNNVYLYLHT